MRYHINAITNKKQRREIYYSQESYRTLAEKYSISLATIYNWKHYSLPIKEEDRFTDRAYGPRTTYYALSQYEQDLICGLRKIEWISLDDLIINLNPLIPVLTRSNTYRTLKRNRLNRKPKEKREIGTFKKYDPGYIHMDVFYLPKLNGKKAYVFVAVDRTTKMIFLEVYQKKTKESALDFLKKSIAFFPFKIHRILTDNGREFTLKGFKNKYGKKVKLKKEHIFTSHCHKNKINHKTTKIKHPWTNGQVERLNGILEEQTIKKYYYQNHQEIYVHLKNIQTNWNYFKRHKTLNLKTIPQILQEWHIKKPEIFRVQPKLHCSQNGET